MKPEKAVEPQKSAKGSKKTTIGSAGCHQPKSGS
jgi:hypothetical protein